MRSFLGSVLATLLVLTTPVGAGQGVHQGDLLHPLLPHLHFVNGRLVLHDAGGATETRVQTGPALGAGAFGDAAGLGTAISPTVPRPVVLLPITRPSLPVWLAARKLSVPEPLPRSTTVSPAVIAARSK